MSSSTRHNLSKAQALQANLPLALYSADGVRNLDRYLIDEQGLSAFELMQTAARSAFRQLLRC